MTVRIIAYAWKCISEWDFECTVESLGALLYEAFAQTVMRRLVIGGVSALRYMHDDNVG